MKTFLYFQKRVLDQKRFSDQEYYISMVPGVCRNGVAFWMPVNTDCKYDALDKYPSKCLLYDPMCQRSVRHSLSSAVEKTLL